MNLHVANNLFYRELPSLKREYKGKQKRNISSTLGDDSDDDEAEAIYAQRAARCLQHLAAV
jgi:hypothetical protein